MNLTENDMKHHHPVHYVILIVAVFVACATTLQAAPPTKVTVTAADPNSAIQGEMLPVEISGDGFDSGSHVRFLVSGSQDDDEILVESVEFVSPGKLRAQIRVRDDALVIDYDIEVRSSSGRRGKGTALFSVKSSNDNGGGLGGGNNVPANVIQGSWSGGTGASDLNGPRVCAPGETLHPEHGHYPCELTGVVQFNLAGGVLVGKKGSQDWCDSFDVLTTANTGYSVNWSGDCTTGNCTIAIQNTAYGTHDINEANGWPSDVGLLIIKAYGWIPALSTAVNPFFDPLVVDIDHLQVGFNELGSNRTLATCEFLPAQGELIFITTPQ